MVHGSLLNNLYSSRTVNGLSDYQYGQSDWSTNHYELFRNQSRNQTGLKKQLEDSPNFQRRKNQPKFEALNIDCDDEPD